MCLYIYTRIFYFKNLKTVYIAIADCKIKRCFFAI